MGVAALQTHRRELARTKSMLSSQIILNTMTATVDLIVQREVNIPNIPTDADLYMWVTAALNEKSSNYESTNYEVVIRIVGIDESTELNQTFRHTHGPTNVLSFPFVAPPQVAASLLGDIVVCAPLVFTEAREQRKSPSAHWAHLVIHGILHLCGYDHDDAATAEVMEDRERLVLAKLGYPDPYFE